MNSNNNQNRLLVPMNIEALVIGETAEGAEWVNLKPDFRKIFYNKFLGQQLENDACSTTSSNLYEEPGIYLHWALPDGLTHGIHEDKDEGPEFPLIPNRWLIIRLWDPEKTNQQVELKSKAWIIESDTISDKKDGVVWPRLNSEKAKLQDTQDYYIYVGKQFELSQWQGETSDPGVDITAIGYGDAAFAAYYPACKGILGFHDKDIEELKKDVSLTYFVAGWYSNPSRRDPLHKALSKNKTFEILQEFLSETKWTYPGFEAALEKTKKLNDLEIDLKETKEMLGRINKTTPDSKKVKEELQKKIDKLEDQHQTLTQEVKDLEKDIPDQILCHGIISGIEWKNKDTIYDSGIPRGKPFSVSVGNTAVEALTALFRQKLDSSLVKLLEVFQYDLLTELEKPGGYDKVEQKIHERTFKPHSHGIRWDLIQDDIPIVDDSMDEKAPPIPGDIRILLENLNNHQRIINQKKRELNSLKSELYAIWYKRVLKYENKNLTKALLDQQHDKMIEIEKLKEEIANLDDSDQGHSKGDVWDQLQEKLKTLLPGYKLQLHEEPRFWRPNDPVLLFTGDAFQRSFRHGEDGRYRSDGQLLCRLSGQEITQIKITRPYAQQEDVEFGATDLDRWCNPFAVLDKALIPDDVIHFFQESLLLTLDKKRANYIFVKVYERNSLELDDANQKEIEQLSSDLINKYFKKIWKDAENPDIENPELRRTDEEEQTTWELVGSFPSPIVRHEWKKNPWLPLFLQWQVSWVPYNSNQELGKWDLNDEGTGFKLKDDNVSIDQGNAVNYNGTTLLTPSAAIHLSDKLRHYNLTHDNPKLKAFQTAVHSMNLLCQSLGGFTDQLLMRKSRMELSPLEPGENGHSPQPSPDIFDTVKDIEWLSPLNNDNSKLFPVRAGHLKLEKLWIIDAFGQVLKLENQDKEKDIKPILPDQFKGVDEYIRLEPRLTQPARLTIQWLSADRWGNGAKEEKLLQEDEAFNPVCGWILPNFLDQGLMIYDAWGNAIGALQAVQRKSWTQGVGAKREEIESFHWIDIPGSETFYFGHPPDKIIDPLEEKANPHLRAFVKSLLSLNEGSGSAFDQLLLRINEALSVAGGSAQNPNLALLIGKPLALVRASIRMELDGRVACDQGENSSQGDPTGGITKVKFPVRLGDRRKWNDIWLGDDGLVGFFMNQNYSNFYPAFGLEGKDDSYSMYRMSPEISVGEQLDLTLLMDPSKGICATTGILPRTIFHLPYGDIIETLENKQIVFFTGPLVSTEANIRMPQPSDIYGQWSWTHHPDVKVWREEPITDPQKEQGKFFDTSLQITEGWLKLITAPLSIRFFKLRGKEPVKEEGKPKNSGEVPVPAQFEISAGETVILSWVVTGAEQIELRREKSSLFKSDRHPLPTQYLIQVDQDTSFTLKATDRAKKTAEKTIKIKIGQKSN